MQQKQIQIEQSPSPAIERALAEAALLHNILLTTAGEENLERILVHALKELSQIVNFTGGSIALVEKAQTDQHNDAPNDANDALVIRVATGPFADVAVGQRLLRQRGGRSWKVIETGESFFCNDLLALGYNPTNPLRSYLAVPLSWRNRGVFGMLEVDSTETDAFVEADLTLMQKVAAALSGPIELARLYQEAQEAVRVQKELNDDKDLMISIVGHELRNPLTTIHGYAQLLQSNLQTETNNSPTQPIATAPTHANHPEPNKRNLTALKNILRQTEHMNKLISELLDFSRLRDRQPLLLNRSQATNMVHLLERVVEQQKPAIRNHNLNLERGIETEILVSCDESRVEQVITNLITNACKYSPLNSTVSVGLLRQQNQNASEVVVWVRDQGYGISEQEQTQIFSRYYRTRNRETAQVQGWGLGLYISYEIIRQHGGRMWVESEVGKGSTFYFALPLLPTEN